MSDSAANTSSSSETSSDKPRKTRLRIVRPQRPVETAPSTSTEEKKTTSSPQSTKPEPPKPAKPAVKPVDPITEEESFLRRQYGAGMVSVTDKTHCFDIAVRMGRDFPFDVQDNALTVRVTFPAKYPADPCTFQMRNSEIPANLRAKIDGKMAERAKTQKGNSGMASNVLRFLKNRAETLLVDKTITENFESGITVERLAPTGKQISILDAVKSGGTAGLGSVEESVPGGDDLVIIVSSKKSGGKPIAGMKSVRVDGASKEKKKPPEQKPPETEEVKEDKTEKEGKAPTETKSEPEPEPEPETKTVSKPESGKSRLFSTTTAHKGTQIRAEGLSLSNVGVLQCTRICAVYNCTRCGEQDVALLGANEQDKEECLKCHAEISLCFRPDLLHEASSVVGYIDKEGAGLTDFTSSCYVMTCLACGAETEGITLQAGVPFEGNCRECHERFSIAFEALRAVRVKTEGGGDQAPKKKKTPKEPGIEPGKPLPENGTCKHYKHSYRWLRFPCCGRAFPCDRCHDEQSDHPCVFANRQICGHCAKEQQSSNTVCSSCGSSFTNSATKHWEGGSGCRDKSKMDRHENKKFAGMGKTVSRAAKNKAEAKKK